MPAYAPRSTDKARYLSVALALAVTVLGCLPLLQNPGANKSLNSGPPLQIATILLLSSAPRAPSPSATPKTTPILKQPTATSPKTRAQMSEVTAPTPPDNADNEAGPKPSPATVAEDNAASAPYRPLDLSAPVVRQAIRDAMSPNRQAAGSSGTYFGDDPRSKNDKLAKEVAEAKKEDCIRPDESASILSAFVIAYNVLKDKCK